MQPVNMKAFLATFLALAVVALAADLEKSEDKIPTSCPDEDSEDGAVHIAHERECTLYYICTGGSKVLMRCPIYMDSTGHKYLLHFNPKAQTCDWPTRSGCKGISCPKDSSGKAIREAHETDCVQYYDCMNDKRDLRKCKSGEKFDRMKLECVNGADYDCDKKDDICPEVVTTLLPHESDCERYYLCKNGKATIKICPSGLHFNADTQECDNPELAGCLPN